MASDDGGVGATVRDDSGKLERGLQLFRPSPSVTEQSDINSPPRPHPTSPDAA